MIWVFDSASCSIQRTTHQRGHLASCGTEVLLEEAEYLAQPALCKGDIVTGFSESVYLSLLQTMTVCISPNNW